jgi:hypothetical protein
MGYRAFWLDTQTGKAIELGRGVASEVHIQYVLEHPETFGFSGSAATKMEGMAAGRVPYELSDYPEWIVKPLLARWVKVRIDERYVNFMTRDRPSRQQLEAMQDWFMGMRFRQGVFLMGEPSGKILARFHKPEDFLAVRQPGELRRIAAQFRVGQVWGRRDGLRYRLVARTASGWNVQVGRDRDCWQFTHRHLHNLVCSERLRLVQVTAGAVAERLRAAGLDRLAREVRALLPDETVDALDAEQMMEEKLEDETDERSRDRLRQGMEKVQDTLKEEVRLEPTNRIAPPNFTNRDSVREPHRITR